MPNVDDCLWKMGDCSPDQSQTNRRSPAQPGGLFVSSQRTWVLEVLKRMDLSGLLPRIAFSAAIVFCIPSWPSTLSNCDGFRPDPENSSIRDHERYIDCIKLQIITLDEPETTLGSVKEPEKLMKVTKEQAKKEQAEKEKAKKEQAKNFLDDKLVAAEGKLLERVNQAFFDKQSNFVGIAFLREPGAHNTNDSVEITGLQYIKSLNDRKTLGIGGFFAINFTGEMEIQAADYVGIGLAVSGRVAETAHPISFGLGYMIDRVGFSVGSGDSETTQRGDRSGVFIALWFNPISTIQPVLRATKRSN